MRESIAVVGAAGHTGRFVVAELRRRGWPVIPIVRATARLDDAAALDGALSGAAAVINCAGPFFDTAIPVIDAALRARIHYLDVTAEQPTVQAIIATRHEAALSAGVTLLPAAAFYGGLADLLAGAAVAQPARLDEISVAVALDSWHPTEGTRRTGERNTARRLIVEEGRLQPIEDPHLTDVWTFPRPFGRQEIVMTPLSETIVLFRHFRPQRCVAWMNRAPLEDLHNPLTPPPVPQDERGRSSQKFVMDVLVRSGGRQYRATASGRDIYAVTAPIVVEAAVRLISGKSMPGVRSLAELFEPRDFLAALEPEGLHVSYG